MLANATQRSSRIVESDGVKIEVVVEGNGQPIVILPSMGRDGFKDYDEVVQILVDNGFSVLRPQPRGVGQSTGPMEGVRLEDLARDVKNVIDALTDGNVILVGHAYGHFVARMIAHLWPENIQGVILAASAARDTKQRFPEIWTSPDIACNISLSDAIRLEALRLSFFSPVHDPEKWLNGWYHVTHIMQEHALIPMDLWWNAGSAPLLQLIGADDPFMPRDRWDELPSLLGERVETVVIENAAHAFFPEQPIKIAQAIIAWAKKQGNQLK